MREHKDLDFRFQSKYETLYLREINEIMQISQAEKIYYIIPAYFSIFIAFCGVGILMPCEDDESFEFSNLAYAEL